MFHLVLKDINNKSYKILCIGTNNTIDYLRSTLHRLYLQRVNPQNINIIFNGKVLVPWTTLADNKITSDSILQFTINIKSGLVGLIQ